MRSLALFLIVALGCGGSSRERPIPQRAFPPELDNSFFEAPADTTPKMRVHLIDVGQGAATLIEFSCAAILIDTGGEEHRRYDSTRQLMDYLHAFFRSRPDLNDSLALLVLTHPHIDHTRAAPIVMGEFDVKNLVTDGLVESSGGKQQRSAINAAKTKGIPIQAIRSSAIPAGGLTSPVIDPVACPDGDPDIRVLWGAVDHSKVRWNPKDLENKNNDSVTVRVTLGKSSILITGDLEEAGIDELLDKHRGTPALDVDVYQVGHHGSYNATTAKLLRALTPKLALIACGPYDRKSLWTGWAYGHPRAVTIALLEHSMEKATPRPHLVVPVAPGAKKFEGWEITAPIYATGWDSDVLVTMTTEGVITVKTRRPQ
ncbi:MAG: MBL fold metallo-hydrolase [Kofleriaceae bacterium]